MSRKGSSRPKTPIRRALRAGSELQAAVENGLGAVKKSDRECIAIDLRAAFADSLDLDEALRAENPQANRWDYLLGHGPTDALIGVEPHPGSDVSKMIAKKKAAQQQLRQHLRDGQRVSAWIWVASGRVQFARTERATLRLAQRGVSVTRVVRARDVAGSGR